MGIEHAIPGTLRRALAASLALASCADTTPSQCGETFCLIGSDFGELRKNPPRLDFSFYRTEFRGVTVGISEGGFPPLPEQESRLAGNEGLVWSAGCLNEACSIWVAEPADPSGDILVVSVPTGERAVLEDLAMAVMPK